MTGVLVCYASVAAQGMLVLGMTWIKTWRQVKEARALRLLHAPSFSACLFRDGERSVPALVP